MIVGPGFSWLHFPKCAGTETEAILHRLFGHDPALEFDVVAPGRINWHHSIPERRAADPGFDPSGRAVICNIRRLPSWLLSRVHSGLARVPEHRVTREMLLQGRFPRHDGHILSADDLMRRYTAHPVARWIRTEQFAQDFRAAFSPYLTLPADITTPNANRAAIPYVRDPSFHFTEAEIAGLYQANPLWAEVEARAYAIATPNRPARS